MYDTASLIILFSTHSEKYPLGTEVSVNDRDREDVTDEWRLEVEFAYFDSAKAFDDEDTHACCFTTNVDTCETSSCG
jgi:hypothetical protein